MIGDLINPADPPARQTAKLLTIAEVLMRRIEQATDDSGAAYAQFQRAAMLEDQVSERTRDLERALDLLNASNAALAGANRATEAARRNLADAIETVQEGFALFDADDVLVMCNSRFGRDMADIHPDLKPGLRFDDYVQRVSRSVHLDLPGGETPEAWAVQRRRRHQDRHVMFNVAMTAGRWMQVSEHRTADGGTVILQTDVTDIIRLERDERGRMLNDQARIVRATLDHIDQGVCIFDAGSMLVGWNARLAEMLAVPVARMYPGKGFDQLLRQVTQSLQFGAGMTAARLEAWVDGRRGRASLRFEVRREAVILSVFAQEMPDGGFVMSFTDVTAERGALAALSRANETLETRVTERTLELQDALEGAERANASRTRFVAAASHDLLQPLSAAKLFLSSIADPGLPARAAEAVVKAQNALLSVEAILAALLDISKLESGRAAVTPGPVRLDRLLAQLADEFAPVAAAKGLALRVVPCGVGVVSDATYLRRILQNLIGNAVRYTDRGRVLVGVRRRGAMVRIEVWDSGPGIPEAEQDNIFKEFHRLDAPASASEGMGLGLAIVERACGLLGHPLELTSVVGRGTVFRLHVPVDVAAEVPALPLRVAWPEGRIAFLVEADPDLRLALLRVLESWGVAVLEAASGEEALALIDELGILPDAFLVGQDLGRGMSGLDFAQALRARGAMVPLRLLSADRSTGLRAMAGAVGAEVMAKPMDADALRAFVAGASTTNAA